MRMIGLSCKREHYTDNPFQCILMVETVSWNELYSTCHTSAMQLKLNLL